MESLSKPQEYFYSVLGSLSFIFGLIFIYCYIKFKSFPHPPGVLILWISVSCTILSFYYSYSSLKFLLNIGSYQNSICSFHGFLIFFTRILSWNLSLVLSIELIQKVPLGFQARVFYYNLLCTLLTIFLSILAYLTDSFGFSFCRTCYLKNNTLGEHSIWIFWAYTPFVFLAVFLKPPKEYFISQKLLLTFWTCNIPFGINQVWGILYEGSNVLIDIEAFWTSIAGLIIYLVALIFYVSRDRLQIPLLKEVQIEYSDEKLSELKKYKLAVFALLQIFELSPKFTFSHFEEKNFFNQQKSFELSKNSDSELTSVLPCTLTQYSAEVFANICAKDNISKSEIIDCLLSMKNDAHLKDNMSNYSYNILIKFVTNNQLKYFLENLPSFYSHLVETSRNKSLLNRIIGAFSLKVKKNFHHFIVLENILPAQTNSEMFELNGSKIAKQVLDGNKEKVFNDLDFMQKCTRLDLKYPERNLLLKVCKGDFEYLKSIGALNYTFFLAIINNCNKIGLTSRFTRHYFDGKEKKVYAIGIIFEFINSDMLDNSILKKIGGVNGYSERLTNLLTQITQCGEF